LSIGGGSPIDRTTVPGPVRHRLGIALFLSIACPLSGCGAGGSEPEHAISGGDGTATLQWDSSPSPGVDGYRIYYGTEQGLYAEVANVGNVTTYTLTGLKTGTTYYFAATAYDSSNNESVFSNVVAKVIP
jgi:Fibronectin type III domain